LLVWRAHFAVVRYPAVSVVLRRRCLPESSQRRAV
jgi:hypothetical protein